MSSIVEIELSEGIAEVRLNRPEKHNALDLEMFEAISAAGVSLLGEPALRVVVLSGNGPSFCAGLDFSAMRGLVGGDLEIREFTQRFFERGDGPENFAQRPAYIWKKLPVPVIAALHGVAYGGGCQIALAADIRIAAPDARLSIMEMKYGLIPDMSITQTLPDLVGLDVAKELTLTARVLAADEARELGLVTKIADDPLASALELARTIAAQSPDAVRACKALYDSAWRRGAEHGLQLEAALQGELIGAANQMEAVRAAMERRAPRFSNAAEAATTDNS